MTAEIETAPDPAEGQGAASGSLGGEHSNATTQQDRLLRRLIREDAVCVVSIVMEDAIFRASAIVHRLRKRGFEIWTQHCDRPGHRHPSGQVMQYRLIGLPFDPTGGQ